MIYHPEEDSYLLERVLKKYVQGKHVLDMGTGSGILAWSAKENGAESVLAVDIQEEAVEEVKKRGIDAIQSDLFSKVDGLYEVIVCNPPYLPKDDREDLESARATTGGEKGDEFLLRFLEEASRHLQKRGVILTLVSSLTPKKKIEEKLQELNMKKRKVETAKIFMENLEVWEIKRLEKG